jgi:hypothetical protein
VSTIRRCGPLWPSWPTGLRRPLSLLPYSSPTSVTQATVGLAGAATLRAVMGRPPVLHGRGSGAPSVLPLFPLIKQRPTDSPPPFLTSQWKPLKPHSLTAAALPPQPLTSPPRPYKRRRTPPHPSRQPFAVVLIVATNFLII